MERPDRWVTSADNNRKFSSFLWTFCIINYSGTAFHEFPKERNSQKKEFSEIWKVSIKLWLMVSRNIWIKIHYSSRMPPFSSLLSPSPIRHRNYARLLWITARRGHWGNLWLMNWTGKAFEISKRIASQIMEALMISLEFPFFIASRHHFRARIPFRMTFDAILEGIELLPI